MRALLLLALFACSEPKKWIDVRATQLHVGSIEVDIPAGWRDINELADKSKLPPLPAGTRTLLPESLREISEIMVFPIAAVIKGDDCANFATVIAEQSGQHLTTSYAQGASFAGSPGCMMNVSVDGQPGKLRILTPAGGSTVGVRCIGMSKDLEATCDKIVYNLHVTPRKGDDSRTGRP